MPRKRDRRLKGEEVDPVSLPTLTDPQPISHGFLARSG
jgi:hypothetical protein